MRRRPSPARASKAASSRGRSSRMGAGTTQVNPKAIADVRVGGVTATANVGFRYRADDVAVEDLGFGNEVTYGAGVGYDSPQNERSPRG